MKKWLFGSILCVACATAQAQIQKTYYYGVIPTVNITTFEVNPTLTVVDDSAGISMSGVTLKTYRVLSEELNWGVEVPLARYESPEK